MKSIVFSRQLVGQLLGSLCTVSLIACGSPTASTVRSNAEALTQGAGPAIFAKVDANGDGKIEANEVPADVWAVLSKADANGDGGVTMDEIVNALVAGLIAPPHGLGKHPHSPPFWKLDTNGDGAIDQQEAGKFWPELSKADANGDGKVTEAELQAAIANGTFTPPGDKDDDDDGHKGPSGATGSTGQKPPKAPEVDFDKLDANKNGTVTQAEAGNDWAVLSVADADKNGEVTKAEFDAAVKAGLLRAEEGDDDGKDGDKDDQDGDHDGQKGPSGCTGKTGQTGIGGVSGGTGPTEADEIFDKLDANKDGFLDKTEVQEPLWSELLAKADTDKDGKISKAEFEAVFPAGHDDQNRP
jgi:Ca2+-binding EF-hand superfamily protein